MPVSTKERKGMGLEGGVQKEFEDGRSYDSAAVQHITQNWVEQNMKGRQMDFTKTLQAKIFCGTWNVNGKIIDSEEEDLANWLRPADSPYTNEKGEPVADIYCVGFQEMVDLTVKNVAVDSKSQQRCQFWEKEIANCLSKSGHYTQIISKHLVGILLCVFVKDSLLSNVTDVRATSTGVGVMGVMGNKGGVCCRFTLHDSSICIVCAHLAAHRDNVAGRNADFQNIVEKSLFLPQQENLSNSQEHEHDTSDARKVHYSTGLLPTDELSILEHDIVLWIGDLNYRIDESIFMEDVFQKIGKQDWAYLREYDQLNIERFGMNVFEGFLEGELNFPPTYKYQPGTNEYDTRPDKKIRCPAWCDRILWRSKTMLDSVDQVSYTRSELVPSDHKPVMSLFTCSIRKIIREKEREVFLELMRELDKCENDTIPRVEMTLEDEDFGLMHFQEPKVLKLKLKNVGLSAAKWRFIPKRHETMPCKRWMSFEPALGMLLPNQETEISLIAIIDALTANALNTSRDTLDDILVLRIENGKDFFVVVKGTYARSCFGMSLAQLVCANEPVRNIPLPSSKSNPSTEGATEDKTDSNDPAKAQMSIPKELWRLVDAIWQGGMRERDLFSSNADQSEVSCIRECLDTGAQFPPCSAHSLAEVLVTFISSLPNPLLPPELYPTLADVEQHKLRGWSRNFLEQLPPVNYNVFVYLVSFERELLSHREFNRLSAVKLAAVNVSCMMVDNSARHALIADDQTGKKTVPSDNFSEAKAALHAVMLHFLTSSAL